MSAVTAYHEAGHAVMATLLGGHVLSATLERDTLNDPSRDGQVRVAWSKTAISKYALAEAEALAILAGPVAEMIHRGETYSLENTREWQADWALARECLSKIPQSGTTNALRTERMMAKLFTLFQTEPYWQAISEVADLLDAHQTIEGDEVVEVVRRWITG